MDFLDDEFDEILRIFLVESEEIISRLNNNLLILEKNPGNKEIILEIFRDAHSLKGAARMLGFTNVQNIAHKIEDILGLAKDNKTTLNSKMVDVLYKTVDFLAALIQKSVAAKHEIYTEDIDKQIDILENIQNYKDKVAVTEKANIDIKFLADNIKEINTSISNCLFLLMRLELEKNWDLIDELLQSTKKLNEIFNQIGFFEIKQEFNSIDLKLDFVKKASNSLTPEEIEELGQKFNFIIESLVSVCEVNNLEIVDFYAKALDEMSDFNKQKTDDKTDSEERDQIEKIQTNNLELDEKAIESFDDNDVAKEEFNEISDNSALDFHKDEKILEADSSVVPGKEENLSLLQLKNIINDLNNGNSKIKEIVTFIDAFKKESSNSNVSQILDKIKLILSFAEKRNILLSNDNIDAIKQGIDYCDNVQKNINETVDNSLILQRLEIVQQLLEIQSSNEISPNNGQFVDNNFNSQKKVDFSKIFDTGEIKTLRVDSGKLDRLVNQVGELIVAKMKTKKHIHNITEINNKLEDWQRTSAKIINHLKYYEKKVLNITSEKQNPISILLKQILALQEENVRKINSAAGDVNSLQHLVQEDDMKMGIIVEDLEQMVKNVRVLPIATIFHMFGRMVRDIANEKHKKIDLEIIGSETSTDKKIIEEIKTPLMHILRNAIDHGIETPEERLAIGKPPVGKITMRAKTVENEIVIEVEDDGRGINLEKIKDKAINNGFLTREEVESMPDEQIMNIIFAPGFSTGETITDISGRGIGLDVVQTKISQLNGKIKVISEINKGCCLRIELPTTMSTLKAFLVKASGQNFAVSLSAISGIVWQKKDEIFSSKDGRSIKYKDVTTPVYNLSDILKMPKFPSEEVKTTILIIGKEGKYFGLEVDKLIGEQDILHKKLSAPLYRIKNISGVTTLETGEICLILNMSDLYKTVTGKKILYTAQVKELSKLKKQSKDYTILIVDDSITTRTLEKNILERAGYNVKTSSNPIEAQSVIKQAHCDLIISDVEMPEMNGFDFLKNLKTNEMYNEIPFIFVSSVGNDTNIKKAKEYGAVKYIAKHDFNQDDFLNLVGKTVEKSNV